jgi:hypothetical protein
MKIWRAVQSSVRWILGHFIALSLVSSCLLMLWVFANKIPPTSVEVMAGVKGAYFETASQKIESFIKKDGFSINISNTDNSSDIVNEIISPKTKTEAGFIAQDIKGIDLSSVESYGVVAVRGMMIFAKDVPQDADITAISSKSIIMLPESSASSQVCIGVLNKYFSGATRPKYVFASSLPDAINSYVRSASEAICIFDDYRSEPIRRAALAPRSVPLEVPDALALAQDSGWLTTKKIPSGTYSTNPRLPQVEMTTIGLPIQFFGKTNLHVAAKVALSRAIFSAFSIDDRIDERIYPYFPSGGVPYSSRAESIYDGGLPWMYKLMPFRLAALCDAVLTTYGVWFALLYFVTNLYMFLGFVTPAAAFQRRRTRSNEKFVAQMMALSAEGKSIGKKDAKHLERLRSSLSRSIVNETHHLDSIEAILSDRDKHSSSV